MSALDAEVESLKASLSSAEQQVSDLEQQLASHAETHQATLEALQKQAETLQVYDTVSHQSFLLGVLLSMTSLVQDVSPAWASCSHCLVLWTSGYAWAFLGDCFSPLRASM